MKFQVGDLIQLVEDPMSYVVPEELNGKFAIVVSVDKALGFYTVITTETNYKLKVLNFMMKCA